MVVMIVWYLDLQLPVQSVPITTKTVLKRKFEFTGSNQILEFI
jgi:hypothetical protein